MSMGMIKSGEYVPCGASATLMSQYPMKPFDGSYVISSNITEFTATCAGEFVAVVEPFGAGCSAALNGVTFWQCGDHANNQDHHLSVILNKGDVVATDSNGYFRGGFSMFRPFAVGEIL